MAGKSKKSPQHDPQRNDHKLQIIIALITGLAAIIVAIIQFGSDWFTPPPISTPSPSLTNTPSQTPSPMPTLTPSQTPSLTTTFTPSPTPTCPAEKPERRENHKGQHAHLAEVHYMIKRGPVMQIAFGETITLNHGDLLELTQIKYIAPADRPSGENFTLEAYYQFGNCSDYFSEDGRFSTGSSSIVGGEIPQPIPDLGIGSW